MTNRKEMEIKRGTLNKANYLIMISPLELEQIVKSMVDITLNTYLKKNKQIDTIYLTRSETAKFLKISLPTLHNWTEDGILKAYKINTRVRYIKSEVEQMIKI